MSASLSEATVILVVCVPPPSTPLLGHDFDKIGPEVRRSEGGCGLLYLITRATRYTAAVRTSTVIIVVVF